MAFITFTVAGDDGITNEIYMRSWPSTDEFAMRGSRVGNGDIPITGLASGVYECYVNSKKIIPGGTDLPGPPSDRLVISTTRGLVSKALPAKATAVSALDLQSGSDIQVSWHRSPDDIVDPTAGWKVKEYRIYSGASLNAALAAANSGAGFDAAIDATGAASYSKKLSGYSGLRYFVVSAVNCFGSQAADHAQGDGTYASATPTANIVPILLPITCEVDVQDDPDVGVEVIP